MIEENSKLPYRVLARKYRPATFDEVIGQKALIGTLTNAIASGRVSHAFMLTGVRGVGKTTTARLIARALNCIGPDGKGGPTINPCGVCEQCLAIAEDRHVDILEMDAASRTGIDDIRELIESVRYHPVSARNKIYIIDEVHMLSKSAFNALLKTLEEPPEHVHFIFATTEVRRVPVTVLSRCQRFDLRRISGDELAQYFKVIADKESVKIEEESLVLIANAADGSVRDGLSLLDRAITLDSGSVSAELVRDMLGLADRSKIFDLFENLMAGRIVDALDQFAEMYRDGVDPITVIQDLLEVTHWLTKLNIAPDMAEESKVPEIERIRGLEVAKALPISVLSRAWQMLVKGLSEVQISASPRQACEMVLIRLAYVAELPLPADLILKSRSENDVEVIPSKNPNHESILASKEENPSSAVPVVTSPPNDGRDLSESGNTQAALALSVHDPLYETNNSSRQNQNNLDPEVSPKGKKALNCEPKSFQDVVALFLMKRELVLHAQLYNNVHLVHFEFGRLEMRLNEHAHRNLANSVSSLLSEWTDSRWIVSISSDQGKPTLAEEKNKVDQKRLELVKRHPLVSAATETFPGANITRVTEPLGPDDTVEESTEDKAIGIQKGE